MNQLGSTTIYVTHDQEEALSLADRIVVMRDGEMRQVGTPERTLRSPRPCRRRGIHGLSQPDPFGKAPPKTAICSSVDVGERIDRQRHATLEGRDDGDVVAARPDDVLPATSEQAARG